MGYGDNQYGQLGCNLSADKTLHPIKVEIEEVKTLAAGELHSIVQKTDGSFWAAGDNSNGQLGDGTNDGKTVFVRISF